MKRATVLRRRDRRRLPARLRSRAGLTLIELVVAMLVLAIGLLGMAGGTGLIIRTVDLAELQTARGAALQSAVEEVRSTPWNDLQAGQGTYGDFTVAWAVQGSDSESILFRFRVVGPGPGGGSAGGPQIAPDAVSTLDYRINRP